MCKIGCRWRAQQCTPCTASSPWGNSTPWCSSQCHSLARKSEERVTERQSLHTTTILKQQQQQQDHHHFEPLSPWMDALKTHADSYNGRSQNSKLRFTSWVSKFPHIQIVVRILLTDAQDSELALTTPRAQNLTVKETHPGLDRVSQRNEPKLVASNIDIENAV